MKFDTNPLTRSLLIGCLALTAVACNSDDKEPEGIEPINTAPEVTSTTVDTVEEGSAYTYTFAATDAEGDTLTITASTLPAWLTFDASTGALTGTPVASDVGDHNVTIDVSDGSLSASQSFTITVSAIFVPNSAPTITSTALVTGIVGVEYSYTLTATDVDGDTLDWSSITLPTWGSFDTSTGTLSGTPDVADNYAAELIVSDGIDSVSQTFTIVVSEASTATVELLVFDNAELPEWALWGDAAATTAVINDDAEHDQVAQFTIGDAGNTVAGFAARAALGGSGGMPFDALAIATSGTISFELKMTKLPNAGVVDWRFKVESSGTGAEVSLSDSQENHSNPVLDTWQTYTFNISDFVAAGLNPNAIDLFMIFPDYANGGGAVFLVDNLIVYSDGASTGGGTDNSMSGGSLVIDIANGINFEGTESEQASWNTFENGEPSAVLEFVANPSLIGNTTNGVAKLTPLAADANYGQFAGAVTRTVQSCALSASNAIVKIWVYKDKISPVGVKFEKNNGDGFGSAGELRATNTLINEWEQLSIDFSAQIGNPETNAITGIAIFPDMVDGRPDDTVLYFDEITFSDNGSEVETGGGDAGDGNVGPLPPVDFETGGTGAGYTWTVFENADNPSIQIVANPDPTGANESATVAQFTARLDGNPYAGAETAHGDFGPLTLDATNSIIKIMVYKTVMSDVGIKFAIASGGAQGEIKVANTLVNQWQELTFDFSDYIGTAEAINIDQLIVFPDFNARTSETISYFDNITFGSN